MGKMIFRKKAICKKRRFFAVGLILICLINFIFIPEINAAVQGQVTLPVKQIFTDYETQGDPSSTSLDQTFTYRLTPKESTNPMPAGSTASGYTFSATGTDETSIGPIIFTEPGIYEYELSCDITTKAGYTLDQQVYTIQINITSDLTPISVVYMNDGAKTSEICFYQSYGVSGNATDKNTGNKTPSGETPGKTPSNTQSNTPGNKPITGDNSNPMFWMVMMAGCIVLLIFTAIMSRKFRRC